MKDQINSLKTTSEDVSKSRKYVLRQIEAKKLDETLDKLHNDAQKAFDIMDEKEKQHEKLLSLQEEIGLLKTKIPDEVQLTRLEEQLQQLPIDYADAPLLADEVQTMRAKRSQFDALKLKLSDETSNLDGEIDYAQSVENDANANLDNIVDAIEKLGKATEHLNVVEKIYEDVTNLPGTDDLRNDLMDKVSNYGEKLKSLIGSLEERQDCLKKFNSVASDAENGLNSLSEAFNELGTPTAQTDRSKVQDLYNKLNNLRENGKQFEEYVECLSPLTAPTMRYKLFSDGCKSLEDQVKVCFY